MTLTAPDRYPSAPTENARRASEALTRYKQQVEVIRQDTRLREQVKRQDIAAAYRAVQEQVEAYREADREDFAARTVELERRAFGLGSGLGRGIDAISARDAGDRAAQIRWDVPDEAEDLLERARLNDDTILEKAIAAEANRRGRADLLEIYGATHPEFAPQLAELETIRRLPTDLGYVSWFYLVAPPENQPRFGGGAVAVPGVGRPRNR